jgi:hypothetical protein
LLPENVEIKGDGEGDGDFGVLVKVKPEVCGTVLELELAGLEPKPKLM